MNILTPETSTTVLGEGGIGRGGVGEDDCTNTLISVHKSVVTEQNCGTQYTLRAGWDKTVTCSNAAASYPREISLTNLCVIG